MFRDMFGFPPSTARSYAYAMLGVAVSTAVTMLVPPLAETGSIFLFLGAVMFGAWHGGIGPAVLALVLSDGLILALFHRAAPLTGLIQLLAFSIVALLIVTLAKRPHTVHALEREIVRREQVETELRASHGRLTDTLESITDNFYAVDRNWTFTEVNAKAADYLGRKREALLGKTLWDLYPELLGQPGEQLVRSAMASQSAMQVELPSLLHPGHWVEANLHPTASGLACYFRDITLRKQAEEEVRRLNADLERRVEERTRQWQDANRALEQANRVLTQEIEGRKEIETVLRERERQLAEAQRLGSLGSWTWNIEHDVVAWSKELFHIYGIREDQFQGTVEAFQNLVHSDDRDMVSKHVRDALSSGQGFAFFHRIIRPNGEVRILRARGETVKDGAGKVIGMFGTGHDVTEMKQVEQALQRAHDELEQRVAERTQALKEANGELHEKIEELERFHDVVVGRELKMIELEKLLQQLQAELHVLTGRIPSGADGPAAAPMKH